MKSPPPPSTASSRAVAVRRPQNAHSQKVAVNMVEAPGQSHQARRQFHLHVSECVETKTVTTTTRLTRKFPHVLVRDPTPLSNLDAKEYPLAMKPTPPELASFSLTYSVQNEDEQVLNKEEDEDVKNELQDQDITDLSAPDISNARRFHGHCADPSVDKHPSTTQELNPPRRSSRNFSESPSVAHARRTRQPRASLADSSYPVPQEPRSLLSTRQTRSFGSNSITDRLRKPVTQLQHGASQWQAAEVSHADTGAVFLATPDASAVHASIQARALKGKALQLDVVPDSREATPMTTRSHYDAASPTESEAHTTFSSTVATPPITDADAEPFGDTDESLQRSIRLHQRPTIDAVAAQDASLPSPRLSPTLAAANLPTAHNNEAVRDDTDCQVSDPPNWSVFQPTDDADSTIELASMGSKYDDFGEMARSDHAIALDTHTLLEAFDSMRTEMKTYMMYQFLRRCSRATLRVIAATVNPALKCDFLGRLPLELGYHILAYLNHRDLCRAAQVSRHWRNLIDRNETGWKELLEVDGFTLPPGELHKAISQGWGWQDPDGPTGCERDLSMHNRLVSSEQDLVRSVKNEPPTKTRNAKRKRALNAYTTTERSKRRAVTNDNVITRALEEKSSEYDFKKYYKSAGPISAANAALIAVPDPQLGLASLRHLHLFKSLYRRHHMIRQSWTSGKVKPRHVAFAAHPRHVITCLQFDEDKIITGSDDTLIHVYDTKTGQLRKRLEGHEGGVWALQYEGNILVSGSTDRSVRVWDIHRGLCQQVFYGHTSTVRCLHILMPMETGRTHKGEAIMQPEKPLIITGSRDSQLRVWRLPEPGSRRYIQTSPPAQESDCPYFIRVLTGHTHSVRAIAAHGDTLVSGSYDSTVRVWRISTGESVHVLQGHVQKVYSVVLDHQRNRCISGSMDSLVKIWDLETGACLYTLEGHTMLVGLLDLRDERLVSAAADSTLRIWDPENGKCRHTLMAHTGAITCFQHDGRKVISGSEKTVKMWDVRSGEWVQDLLTDLRGVWQVKFDQRRCVAAVQRGDLTYVEVLDYGAVRDGYAPEELGERTLLNEPEVRAMIEEEV